MSQITTSIDTTLTPAVATLTGNNPVAVPADAFNNINVVGANGVVVTGVSATHTLTITYNQPTTLNYKQISFAMSPYTVAATDDYLAVLSAGGAITIVLPDAVAGNKGRVVIIKDTSGNALANNITIETVSSQNIDGSATYLIKANYGSGQFISNGSNAWEAF